MNEFSGNCVDQVESHDNDNDNYNFIFTAFNSRNEHIDGVETFGFDSESIVFFVKQKL